MSEDITQSDWNGVYYDRQAEDFYIMDVAPDGVTLINAFTGVDFETLGLEEFADIARDGDFEQVSPDVLDNPAEYVYRLLEEATAATTHEQSASFAKFSAVDADFAMTATTLTFDADAPYYNTGRDPMTDSDSSIDAAGAVFFKCSECGDEVREPNATEPWECVVCGGQMLPSDHSKP